MHQQIQLMLQARLDKNPDFIHTLETLAGVDSIGYLDARLRELLVEFTNKAIRQSIKIDHEKSQFCSLSKVNIEQKPTIRYNAYPEKRKPTPTVICGKCRVEYSKNNISKHIRLCKGTFKQTRNTPQGK